jgi:hypothetical protein
VEVRGGWGRPDLVAKGHDTAMLNVKQIYKNARSQRAELGEEELAA